jgi:uncharacterized integral membrane protein (TIGR00698 family)
MTTPVSRQSPVARDHSNSTGVLRLLPGIFLLFMIGYAGKIIEQSISAYGKAHHLRLPNIEYVLWAILIGALISNLVRVPDLFRPGIATYDFWLKLGIVFLGVRFLLADVVRLGGVSLIFVAIELSASILLMTLLGRWMNLSPKLTSLLAIGSSICGVSAIVAAKGAIDADDEDASYAIGAILALGAFSLFAFPAIGHALGMSDRAFGLWAGLAVDNTAEATAAGALYSETAAKFAILAKTTRNATIGFVVLAYALYWARKSNKGFEGSKGAFLWAKFPKFVLGFLLTSSLASLQFFSKAQVDTIANLSRWAFLLTFAGVGLQTNIGQLRKQGLRPLVVGAVGEFVIAGLTLVMILGSSSFLDAS